MEDKPAPRPRKRIGDVIALVGGVALIVHGITLLTGNRLGEPLDSILRFGGLALILVGVFVFGARSATRSKRP